MKIDGGKKERSEANRTETTPAEENVNIKRKQQHRGKKNITRWISSITVASTEKVFVAQQKDSVYPLLVFLLAFLKRDHVPKNTWANFSVCPSTRPRIYLPSDRESLGCGSGRASERFGSLSARNGSAIGRARAGIIKGGRTDRRI